MKWFLAIPHYVVLFFLDIAAVVVVIVAGPPSCSPAGTPRGMFDFVQGVARWHNRVTAYASTLATDRHPPFRLAHMSARHVRPDRIRSGPGTTRK